MTAVISTDLDFKPEPEPRRGRRSVTAAAVRLPTDAMAPEVLRDQRKLRAKGWQEEAWLCNDAVGQVKQGHAQLADAASKVQLFVGFRTERTAPVELATGQPGFSEASQALDRLDEFSSHGLPGIIREMVTNLEVAGECFLTGEGWQEPTDAGIAPSAETTDEHWEVRSVDELSAKPENTPDGTVLRYAVKEREDGKARPLVNPYVARIWDPHPRWSDEPDSPMRAVLERCDEYLILSRGVRAIGRSRIPAGAWVLPNNVRVLPPSAADGRDADAVASVAETIMQVMMAPLSDESDPAALVPMIFLVDPDTVQHVGKPINFERMMGDKMLDERERLLTSILQSLNFPIEEITGLGGMNHWTGWLLDRRKFGVHVEPDVQLVCHGLTSGFLRPIIQEMGVSPEDARRLIVWYDADPAIAGANDVEDTFKAAKLGAVGLNKIRAVIGASDDDAATEEDLAIMERMLHAKPPLAPGGPGNPTGETPPNEGAPPAARAITAAARQRRNAGQRLAGIDRDLRARLEAAATLAMGRALERAGARVRNKAQVDGAATTAIVSCGNRAVTSTLGPGIVAALGVDDHALLDGAFDDLHDQFDTWVGQAQARSLATADDDLDLSDDEESAVAGQQAEDRSTAWAWFATALLALASSRLYDPNPSAPALGEHDSSLAVPVGVVREALARAGGAAGSLVAGRPAGGVATGTTLLDLYAQHGRPVDGWEWQWGGSSRPFEGHENLDGVAFATWDDDVLAVLPGDEWLGSPFYRPGDHDGCGCDFVPLMADADMAEAA